MARQAKPERLDSLYEAVETYPGERASFFARLLGTDRSSVTRSLPTLEEKGYLLSEDDSGGLWPFGRRK